MTVSTTRFAHTISILFLLSACSQQSVTSIAPGPDDRNKIPGISVNGRAHPFVVEEKPNVSKQVYEVSSPKPAHLPVVKVTTSVPLPLQGEIYFLPNSAWIGPSGQSVVKTWALHIQKNHLTKVLLIGHTDPSGQEGPNKKLSLRRAAAVRWMIKKMGVKGVKIYLRAIGSKGKDGFVRCKPKNWKCYARDRAVRFIVLGVPKKSSP